MKLLPLLALPGLLFCLDAAAAEYRIDYDKSSVRFAGNHAGTDFVGEFGDWKAEIIFDPDNLGQSQFRAEFTLSSASTGNKMYDGTLPTADWFNVNDTPRAVFESNTVEPSDGGAFRVSGHLNLRGILVPVDFDFLLEPLNGNVVQARSELVVTRMDFGIGKESDATADWVTNEISVMLDLTAERIGP